VLEEIKDKEDPMGRLNQDLQVTKDRKDRIVLQLDLQGLKDKKVHKVVLRTKD